MLLALHKHRSFTNRMIPKQSRILQSTSAAGQKLRQVHKSSSLFLFPLLSEWKINTNHHYLNYNNVISSIHCHWYWWWQGTFCTKCQLEQKLTGQPQSNLTSMEDPRGWSHHLQGTPVGLFKGLPWRQLMKKHHLLCVWENCIFLASYRRALETLMWLQINFFWAHSIWKRSHSSKGIRRKLKKNSDLRHNFATGSSALKSISRCSSKARYPEDWINIFILRPHLDSIRNQTLSRMQQVA